MRRFRSRDEMEKNVCGASARETPKHKTNNNSSQMVFGAFTNYVCRVCVSAAACYCEMWTCFDALDICIWSDRTRFSYDMWCRVCVCVCVSRRLYSCWANFIHTSGSQCTARRNVPHDDGHISRDQPTMTTTTIAIARRRMRLRRPNEHSKPGSRVI